MCKYQRRLGLAIALAIGVATAAPRAADAQLSSPNDAGNAVLAPPITYADVLALLKLQISESEILRRLEQSPTVFTLDAAQMAELKQAGASDKLLAAMTAARNSAGPASEITDLAIVLDCSGSMTQRTPDGRTKMEAAKAVVSQLVHELPPGLRVTFVVYGHNKALACQAVQVIRKLEVLDSAGKQELTRLIAQMQAVGATPIALALRTAGQELAGTRSPSGLILISDGMETCQGDPAAEAATLAQNLNLTFGVNVVGFDVKRNERLTLARVAAAGRGKYYDAATSAELAQTLQTMGKHIQQAVKPAPLAKKVARRERVARAVKVLPPAIELPPMAQISVGAAGANLGAVNVGTLAQCAKYGDELRIPVDAKAEAFDVWWFPKEGKGIRLAANIVIDKERPMAEVRAEARVGLVRVAGKDLPPPEFILLCRPRTPRLVVSRATAVQWTRSYGSIMPVAEGTYDLWLAPAEGKTELLAEDVEVFAGKITEVE